MVHLIPADYPRLLALLQQVPECEKSGLLKIKALTPALKPREL
jgi:hypothetical protein